MLRGKTAGLNKDLCFRCFQQHEAKPSVDGGLPRLADLEVLAGGNGDAGAGDGLSVGGRDLAVDDETGFQLDDGLPGEQVLEGYETAFGLGGFRQVDFGGQELRVREFKGKGLGIPGNQFALPASRVVGEDGVVFEEDGLADHVQGDPLDGDACPRDRLTGWIADHAPDQAGPGEGGGPVRGWRALGPLHPGAGVPRFVETQRGGGGAAAPEIHDAPSFRVGSEHPRRQRAEFAGAVGHQHLAVGQGLAGFGVQRGDLELESVLGAWSGAELLHQGEGIGVLFPEERGFVVIAGIADIEDPVVNMAAEQGNHRAELFHLDLFPLAHGESNPLIAAAAGFSLAELIDVGTMHRRLAVTPRLRRATPGLGGRNQDPGIVQKLGKEVGEPARKLVMFLAIGLDGVVDLEQLGFVNLAIALIQGHGIVRGGNRDRFGSAAAGWRPHSSWRVRPAGKPRRCRFGETTLALS